MTKYKGKVNSREDVEAYISEISKMENEIVDEFLKIFRETKDFWIKNKIALFLRKYENEKILEAYIEEIRKPESKNRDGVIVDCCSYYDCTNYFSFFVDIVLNDKTESYVWAMNVIGCMNGPFRLPELDAAIQSLQLAIKRNQDPDKNPDYERLLNFLVEEKVNNAVN